MKKVTFLLFLILPTISFAQIYFGSPIAASEDGSVTATAKNWECIEINPSNLGWSNNHTFSFSVANVGLNFQDNGLNLASRSIINEIENAKNQDSITPQQRSQMYNAVTAPGGLNMSTTINWASFSFTIPKVGGFGVSLTDKLYLHAQLSPNLARILSDFSGVRDTSELKQTFHNDSSLLKQTPAQIENGTNAGGYHYRELNIDYGRKILTIQTHSVGTGGASFQNSEFLDTAKNSYFVSNPIEIYAGFGFKPIWGLGSYSSDFVGGQSINEGTYVYGNTNYTQNILPNIFTANGRGYGVDLGLSASYERWKLGFSVIDLGQITWHNNSFQNAPDQFPTSESQVISELNNNASIFNDIVYYTHLPEPDYTTQLPSQFRAGLSYECGRFLMFSSDFVAPLNTVPGNLLNPYVGVGVHLQLFRIFGLGLGYATEQGFGNLVPCGIYINILYGFEVYAGTNDLLAYVGSFSGQHVLSGSAGLKIFGF